MIRKNTKQVSEREISRITNILLLLVVASVAFLASESYKIRKEQQNQHKELYTLMESFYGHVWTNDLKEDGRRLAVANLFHAQFYDSNRGLAPEKELLKHGIDGIRAYVDQSDKELWSAMKRYATQSSLYGSQIALAILAPKIVGTGSPSLGKEAKAYEVKSH